MVSHVAVGCTLLVRYAPHLYTLGTATLRMYILYMRVVVQYFSCHVPNYSSPDFGNIVSEFAEWLAVLKFVGTLFDATSAVKLMLCSCLHALGHCQAFYFCLAIMKDMLSSALLQPTCV